MDKSFLFKIAVKIYINKITFIVQHAYDFT
jgi:hypothetical protein